MYRKNSTIITTAGVLAILTSIVWDRIEWHYREQQPATDWFVIQNLSVADSVFGDERIFVVYDRTIKMPFYGDWSVEVKQTESQFSICIGSGSSYYEPKDVIPNAAVDFAWLLGTKCALPPGQYYLDITYRLHPLGFSDKEYRATSNIFTVKQSTN